MVSEDFRNQVRGYGLTTAHILYRRPDHRWLLQSYVWQNYDLFPEFPELQRFLTFWMEKLEGPLHSVRVAHCKLIKPAEAQGHRRRIQAALTGKFLSWPACPACRANNFFAGEGPPVALRAAMPSRAINPCGL